MGPLLPAVQLPPLQMWPRGCPGRWRGEVSADAWALPQLWGPGRLQQGGASCVQQRGRGTWVLCQLRSPTELGLGVEGTCCWGNRGTGLPSATNPPSPFQLGSLPARARFPVAVLRATDAAGDSSGECKAWPVGGRCLNPLVCLPNSALTPAPCLLVSIQPPCAAQSCSPTPGGEAEAAPGLSDVTKARVSGRAGN